MPLTPPPAGFQQAALTLDKVRVTSTNTINNAINALPGSLVVIGQSSVTTVNVINYRYNVLYVTPLSSIQMDDNDKPVVNLPDFINTRSSNITYFALETGTLTVEDLETNLETNFNTTPLIRPRTA